MDQVRAGSVDALNELYDRYGSRAYRIARSVCRDPQGAEDAVQDAFLSVWNERASYDPRRGTSRAWIFTLVYHSAIAVVRRDRRHASRRMSVEALESCAAAVDVASQSVSRVDARTLRRHLAELPAAQREVITLAYFGQLSQREIAAHLGLPAGTIKSRMRLGLEKLRDVVEPLVA